MAAQHKAPKYDPADFIVPASDTKGHSERVWARLPPAMDRGLDIVVSSKHWPFRTKGDVIRWAVQRGLRTLESMEPIGSVTAQIDAVATILREDAFQQEFKQIFEALGRTVNQHLADGAQKEAARIVANVKSKLEKMPECYWKEKYLGELSHRYGYLLGGGRQDRRQEAVGGDRRAAGMPGRGASVIPDDMDEDN